jgi:hypothetical protein
VSKIGSKSLRRNKEFIHAVVVSSGVLSDGSKLGYETRPSDLLVEGMVRPDGKIDIPRGIVG